MRNVSPRAPDVNSAAPTAPARWRFPLRLSAAPSALLPSALLPSVLLAVLVLVMSTACTTTTGDTHPGRPGGSAYLVLSAGALAVAIILLNAVGRAIGQIFDLTLNLLKAIAIVGLAMAVVAGAVILAVVATMS